MTTSEMLRPPYDSAFQWTAERVQFMFGKFPRYRRFAYKSLEQRFFLPSFPGQVRTFIDTPRPEVPYRWPEDGGVYTEGDLISLATRNDVLAQDFHGAIAAGTRDAEFRFAALTFAGALLQLSMNAMQKINMRDERYRPTPLETAALELYREGVKLYRDQVIWDEADTLFQNIGVASGDSVNIAKTAVTAGVLQLAGKPIILDLGFAATRGLTRPAYELHAKLLDGLPYFNGKWMTVKVDDREFRNAYHKFAQLYNPDARSVVKNVRNGKIILSEGNSQEAQDMQNLLAKALYFSLPEREFCLQDKEAAYMRWFNNYYRWEIERRKQREGKR